MSVRNTRKNLGTVIECAENVEDTSSTSSTIKNLFKENTLKVTNQNKIDQKKNEKFCNDEDYSFYASAIDNESQETSTRFEQETAHKLSSNKKLGDLNEWLKSEEKISVLSVKSDLKVSPSSTTTSGEFYEKKKRKKSRDSFQNHQTSFRGSFDAFNSSKLNLITFLNNIATPSQQQASSSNRQDKIRQQIRKSRRFSSGLFHSLNESINLEKKTSSFRTSVPNYNHQLLSKPIIVSEMSSQITAPILLTDNIIDLDVSRNENLFDANKCENFDLFDRTTNLAANSTKKLDDLRRNSLYINTTENKLSDVKNSPLSVNTTSLLNNLDPPNSNIIDEIVLNSDDSAFIKLFSQSCQSSQKMNQTIHLNKNCEKLNTTSDLNSVSSCSDASNNSIASLTNTNGTAGSGSRKHKTRECLICCTCQSLSHFPNLINCGHYLCCKSCLVKYLNVEIMESRTSVTCPVCSELLHVNDIYSLLEKHKLLMERYESFALRRVLSSNPDTRWCPAPDCSYVVIATACAACPKLECEKPGCGTMFCYHCKSYWHPNQTCDQARDKNFMSALAMLSGEGSSSSKNKGSKGAGNGDRNIDGRNNSSDTVKPCPRCSALIVKVNDGSCNHMTCALCGVEFCWLCLKQINELHYISPTGCTFWGKKPWTRKKKLLWQIGTLIGAPLGIALIAGLSVPGIICGVPIFAGRKTYQHFNNLTRTKRHLLTAVSVTGSLLISPVLAVMAVGVGVPIMLAYVYGVVPLSLCRNGGCGLRSGDVPDTSDVAYGTDDSEYLTLLNNEGQERSLLLRTLRGESSSKTITELDSFKNNDLRKTCKKQCLEVTLSDHSSTSSPSGAGTSFYLTNNSTASRHCINKSGSISYFYVKDGMNAVAASDSISNAIDACSDAGIVNCSSFGASVTSSQRHHRRQQSNESAGITSLGEKVNTEDASVKAIAGSQHNYDNKSNHTIWSNSAGTTGRASVGGIYCQTDIASYNEDNASTKACGGSVLDARSLVESASSALPYLSLVSCERDISPVVRPQSKNSIISGRESASTKAQSTNKTINQSDKHFINFKNGSRSPPFSFKKSTRKNSSGSKSFDELQNQSQFFEKNKKQSASVKKFSIGTFSSSRKSFYPMYSSSAALSICSNISNINGTFTRLSTNKPVSNFSNDQAIQSGSFNNKTEQSQHSQISLRKLIRRPIDLIMRRSSLASKETRNFDNSCTTNNNAQ